MAGKIVEFFDKLEDKVRGKLSHVPILYAIIGGVGVVLFWRGVWYMADYLTSYAVSGWFGPSGGEAAGLLWWDGLLSLAAGLAILMITGLLVSNFIGNEILISGLKGEKKIAEKTEKEVKGEAEALSEVRQNVKEILEKMRQLESRGLVKGGEMFRQADRAGGTKDPL